MATTRHQKGHIWRKVTRLPDGTKVKGTSWYIRYQSDEVIDGRTVRAQKNAFLCPVDHEHPSKTCKAVKDAAAEFMLKINAETAEHGDLMVADFWETVYLPHISDHKKPSTVAGYKQIWGQHLKNHFGDTTMKSYRTPMMARFLLGLTKTQGQRTLNHIRSLASGIFSLAKSLGYVEQNPVMGVEQLGKVIPPKQTPHYSLEEVENIISALIDSPMAQAIIALSFFAGLRPSEVAGLQWGDIDFEHATVSIRRACVRGRIVTTKTLESVATLPLLPQALVPLMLWRKQAVLSEWVFANERGNPIHMKDVVTRVIRPAVQKAGLKWKTLYACRRGAATCVVELTGGNAQAAAALLRHKPMAVTFQHYIKQNQTALTDGLKALGAAAAKEGK